MKRKRFYSILCAEKENMSSTRVLLHAVFWTKREAARMMRVMKKVDTDHDDFSKVYWIGSAE